MKFYGVCFAPSLELSKARLDGALSNLA